MPSSRGRKKPTHASNVERFMDKVLIRKNGCWSWVGATNEKGYGIFSYNGKAQRAHRVSYILFIGPWPAGMVADHDDHCGDKSCVNPEHIEPVTPGYSSRNHVHASGNTYKTKCHRGHPFNEENTRMYRGARICRICSKLNQRAKPSNLKVIGNTDE